LHHLAVHLVIREAGAHALDALEFMADLFLLFMLFLDAIEHKLLGDLVKYQDSQVRRVDVLG